MYVLDWSCPKCGALLYSDVCMEGEISAPSEASAIMCERCHWSGTVHETRSNRPVAAAATVKKEMDYQI